MRVPAASELVLLARVLTRCRPEDRQGMATAILAEADRAEQHLRLTGSLHPGFGDGSLAGRCIRLSPPAEPLADDREFLECLSIAAQAVLGHSKG